MKSILTLIGIYVLLILSQLSLFVFPQIGIYFTVLVVAIFLFFAVYYTNSIPLGRILTYSAILPSLTLFISLIDIQNLPLQTIIVYGILLIVSELYYSLLPHSYHIYHTHNLYLLPVIITFGIIAGSIYSIYLPSGTASHTYVITIATIILGTAAETLFFQGLIQIAATRFSEVNSGIVYTSILYGVFHLTGDLQKLILLSTFGVCNALLYPKIKNIYLIMLFSLTVSLTVLILKNDLFLTN